MRFMVCLMLVMVGCVATLPDDPALTADIAAETARMVVASRAEFSPAPDPPKPTPNGKCSRCSGTGLLPTDGRIRIECPDCKGTGKQ